MRRRRCNHLPSAAEQGRGRLLVSPPGREHVPMDRFSAQNTRGGSRGHKIRRWHGSAGDGDRDSRIPLGHYRRSDQDRGENDMTWSCSDAAISRMGSVDLDYQMGRQPSAAQRARGTKILPTIGVRTGGCPWSLVLSSTSCLVLSATQGRLQRSAVRTSGKIEKRRNSTPRPPSSTAISPAT